MNGEPVELPRCVPEVAPGFQPFLLAEALAVVGSENRLALCMPALDGGLEVKSCNEC